MVNWPAIIKYADDVELTYVSDQAAWDDDAGLHAFDYDGDDCLIDSSGRMHSLTSRQGGIVRPQANGVVMPLQEFLGLVKAHAAHKGSCCVAKLYAPGMEEALKIVAALEDN